MADKLADLSPEEKEKRLAEMKAKMQASAKKAKAASAEGEAPQETKPAASPAPAAAPAVAAAEAVLIQAEPEVKPVTMAPTNGTPQNGAAGVAVTVPFAAAEPVFVEDTPEQRARKEMNRREFLTYAWGGALALLLLESGALTYFFMYPRFKAGEFGGKFFIGPESALPATDVPPEPYTAGKFWLVNTVDEGPKALYMVCTHLGCLYKWAESNNRFECPCHGSKFSREGFYIEGPAPRSLDTFPVTIEEGLVVVDTGKKVLGAPATESPAKAVPA
jgi:cytochrome b6-f complex iron-sulfur subunit